MNNQGSAIYCNYCRYSRDGLLLYMVLGSVTADGVLIIQRAHNKITRIQFASPLSLYCECGYEAIINPSLELSEYGKQI